LMLQTRAERNETLARSSMPGCAQWPCRSSRTSRVNRQGYACCPAGTVGNQRAG
jgi:hypothetical protein